MPLSSTFSSIETLAYRDVSFGGNATAAALLEPEVVDIAKPTGVPEEEVERRVRLAREEALAELEERLRVERERAREEAGEQFARRLREFQAERAAYFRAVEGEVVQLALAVARKIIGREAEVDPALLAGLVRIALDRMQSGAAVRIRVAPAEAERWMELGKNDTGEMRWIVIADEELQTSDCIVETESGKANFGFDAQLRDLEESFASLLVRRPAA